MAIVEPDVEDTDAHPEPIITIVFELPITGTDIATFNNVNTLNQTNLRLSYVAFGLDADVQVELKQFQTNDIVNAQPIQSVDGVDIVEIIGNGADFLIASTFYGLFGFVEVDPLTATVGTITFTLVANSST